MNLSSLSPKRLLPLMMFVGVLMVGFRVNDIWQTLSDPSRLHSVQSAEAKPAEAKEGEEHAAAPAAVVVPPAPPRAAQASISDDSSQSAMDLVKQLSTRREALDQREQEIGSREALTKVAEQRIDQKIKEMETLRTQLQGMVNQLSATQQQQIENLVKIYETMKPKEAARILETLELPVLLGVVERMKPQRTAVIMAEMNPQKAKDLTVALTRQDQLPKVK